MKQKQQNEILGHGTAVWDMARVVPSFWLGDAIFCAESHVFQPESAPNPLSFAPRLNLSNIRSW